MIVLLALSLCAHAAAKMLPKEQWLYVSDSTKTLRVYKLPLSSLPIVAAVLTNLGNGPGYGMAVDHTGRVYIAEANANLIGVFAPDKKTGRMVELASIQTAKPAYDIAIDAEDNLYAAEPSGNAIEVFKAPVQSSSRAAFSITAAIESPYGLAFGPNGVLFVCNSRSGEEYNPPFEANTQCAGTIAVAGQSQPDFGQGIAIDTKGNAFFGYGNTVKVTVPPYDQTISSAYDLALFRSMPP